MSEGWHVVKTDLHLSIMLKNRTITGTTILHVVPPPRHHANKTNKIEAENLEYLYAHSRQSVITKVTVNGRETRYSYNDYMSGILHRNLDGSKGPVSVTKLRGQPLCKDMRSRDLGSFHHILDDAMEKSDKGELIIDMSRADKNNSGAASTPPTPTKVAIEFHLKDPETGVHFSGADQHRVDENGWPSPTHAYTFRHPLSSGSVMGQGSGARCCFPCVDALSCRCPWSLAIKVTKGMKVFATGRLVERDLNSSTLQDEYYFHVHERVAAHVIGFACGYFRMTRVPKPLSKSSPRVNIWVLSDALDDEDEGTSTGPSFQYYHDKYSSIVDSERGGREEVQTKGKKVVEVDHTVANTVAALWAAINFVRKWLGHGSDITKPIVPSRSSTSTPTTATTTKLQRELSDVSLHHPAGPTLPFQNRLNIVYVQGAPIDSVFFGAGLTIIGEDANSKYGGLQQEMIPGTRHKVELAAFSARQAAWIYFGCLGGADSWKDRSLCLGLTVSCSSSSSSSSSNNSNLFIFLSSPTNFINSSYHRVI
jgi:hypothetical protein